MTTNQNVKASLRLLIFILVAVLTACGGQPTPNPQTLIEAAVAATLAAVPTYTPYPLPTPVSTPTLYPLDGVFCEYGFCIGHPADVYLIDDGARRNPPMASAATNGVLFGYNQSLFVQLAWRVSDPNFDPQATMRLVLNGESTLGNLDAQLFRELNVYYQPISTITKVLPFGAVAAWQCGGRDFIWKIYTPQDGMAPGLLKQALERFRCEGG